LQGPQFTNEARVPAVADCAEVLRVELREKRITFVEIWIMCTQMRFENVTTMANGFEPLARDVTTTVVPSQIAHRLLTLEHCC
jgi:hypothetical protein